jgi:hypothetical protein
MKKLNTAQRNLLLTLLIADKERERRLTLLDFDSDPIETDEPEVTWTVNIAPEDGDTKSAIKPILTELENHIKFLNQVRGFILILQGWGIPLQGEQEFYWSDGDLNLRISIPNPLYTTAKTKPRN